MDNIPILLALRHLEPCAEQILAEHVGPQVRGRHPVYLGLTCARRRQHPHVHSMPGVRNAGPVVGHTRVMMLSSVAITIAIRHAIEMDVGIGVWVKMGMCMCVMTPLLLVELGRV